VQCKGRSRSEANTARIKEAVSFDETTAII
jgi:hypothetical protein